jgi:hypothetical protein
VSSLEGEETQIKAVEEMEKPYGVVNCFRQKETAEAYLPFFSQFHMGVTANSHFFHLISFLNFFIQKYAFTPEDVKKELFEVKKIILKDATSAKERGDVEMRKSKDMEAKRSVGKYIDKETFKNAENFAKKKADELKLQVKQKKMNLECVYFS